MSRSVELLRKAKGDFAEFWSGDPRLPYQGWFGKLAKDHPAAAVALVASVGGNAAWLVLSARNKWFRPSAREIVESVRAGQHVAHSDSYQFLTMVAMVVGGVALLFASIFLIGVASGAAQWLWNNLRSTRAD